MAPKRKNGATAAPAAAKKSKAEAEAALAVGALCPNFTLPDHESNEFVLHDRVRDKGAVIFVYPRANTPGCTKQACGFRDNYEDIARAGYQVVGLSADNPTPQSNWKAKEKLPFPLLCDKSKSVLKMLGFTSGDRIQRSHVVIGKGGIVQMYSPGVRPLDSVQSATAFCLEKGKEGDEEEGAGETG